MLTDTDSLSERQGAASDSERIDLAARINRDWSPPAKSERGVSRLGGGGGGGRGRLSDAAALTSLCEKGREGEREREREREVLRCMKKKKKKV